MNLILIGMPGSGKSTAGVLAAKILCKSFLDADLIIQEREHQALQAIINQRGAEAFLRCEEEALCSIHTDNTVIATGGSAVYSQKGMEHLKKNGIVAYLSLSYEEMLRRIPNLENRGVVLRHGSTLKEMYEERLPLYEAAADITINCEQNSVELTVQSLMEQWKKQKAL